MHHRRKDTIKNNPRVKLLLSNMGRLSAELIARRSGTGHQCGGDARTGYLHTANGAQPCLRQGVLTVASCLGSALKYFSSEKYRKDEIYILFVPTTTGPCRTGQYFVFYENLFKDLRLENVVVFTMDSDNSYTELGADFPETCLVGGRLIGRLHERCGNLAENMRGRSGPSDDNLRPTLAENDRRC